MTLDNFSDEPTSRRLLLSHLASSAQRDKIRLVEGDALESLRSLESSGEAPFDLVFIDADKEGQIAYYDLLMESPLLGDGATILVDNTLWFGKVAVPEEQMDSTTAAIHQFNKHVHDDRRSDVVRLFFVCFFLLSFSFFSPAAFFRHSTEHSKITHSQTAVFFSLFFLSLLSLSLSLSLFLSSFSLFSVLQVVLPVRDGITVIRKAGR